MAQEPGEKSRKATFPLSKSLQVLALHGNGEMNQEMNRWVKPRYTLSKGTNCGDVKNFPATYLNLFTKYFFFLI